MNIIPSMREWARANGGEAALLRVPMTEDAPPDAALATQVLWEPADDEAYRQGYWAFRFGLSIDANPYRRNELGHHWAEGWADANEAGEDLIWQ